MLLVAPFGEADKQRPIGTSFNVYWSAWFDDTYCGCGTCSRGTIGHGRTEAEAIAALHEAEELRNG